MSPQSPTFARLALALSILGLGACASSGKTSDDGDEPAPVGDRPLVSATARMEARSGSSVNGTVTFSERVANVDGKEVRVIDVHYDITGLVPGETRGFHIHELGDCSKPDASTAGGHFNPYGHEHGALHAAMSHAGDLGNITANPAGRAEGDLKDLTKISLVPGAKTYIGNRSLIVHEKVDDLATQPTGNAGTRVACGVITTN